MTLTLVLSAVAALNVGMAVDRACEELWGRFVSPHGILYDYVGELPTPKDCAECRPNAMGWWSPIENGSMFTGPFLQASVLRAKRTGAARDQERCRKLAEGLLLCAEASGTKGMICRGVGSDGRCHYPLGSTDQTLPWFIGMDAYILSGFCPAELRTRLVAKVREVAEELERLDWRIPSDGKFAGEFRGDLRREGLPFRGATGYLFVLRSLADVTGDSEWKRKYLAARDERYPRDGIADTRLDVCAYGYRYDKERIARPFEMEPHQLWIYVAASQCLAALAEREEEPVAAAKYREGLRRGADWARPFIALCWKYDNVAERPFRYANWRTGWRWREQKTQRDAEAVAGSPIREVIGDRKRFERLYVTSPLAAAAICACAGAHADDIRTVLVAYDYSTPAISEFFFAPLAYELLMRK